MADVVRKRRTLSESEAAAMIEEAAQRLEAGRTMENRKNAAAVGKPKTSAVPPIAILALGAAMQNGADKYGKFNWRDSEVTASIFYDAMMRHLLVWYSGENFAGDSSVHHLAHLMAGAAIILDADHNGVFVDDRPKGEFADQGCVCQFKERSNEL